MRMTDVARKFIAGRRRLQMCEANDMMPTRWGQSDCAARTQQHYLAKLERKEGRAKRPLICFFAQQH